MVSAAAEKKQVLHGSVVSSTIANVRAIGPLPDTTRLDLQVGLSLHDRSGLTGLLREIYDPTSPDYRHYVTPQQFTRDFSADAADYQKVIDFLTRHGFEVTGTYANRIVIDITGSVLAIDTTFHVVIGVYHDTENGRIFYAPDGVATVDGLSVPISDVIGLDDFAPPRPIDLVRAKAGEKVATSGSGPGGLFIGQDYRYAYANGVSLDGRGQTVGLFEFGPYWPNDITAYEDKAGIPHAKITNVLLDGYTGVPKSGEDVGEESLDIENAISMAPGASFVVYEGNSAVDIISRIASEDRAKQITCSFGWYPPSSTENSLYQELDAQGQAFFVASGDGGAYADTVQIFSPTDNPDIISVGGTSLVTNGPGGSWSSETGWNGSGGGISQTFLIPNYQVGTANSTNKGSMTHRNFPDVAATAAFQFYFVYNDGQSGGIGGTSGAAPLWAGFTALVNEQAAIHGKPGVGFFNPALYSIGRGQSFSYNPDFHDITYGKNANSKSPNLFSTAPGYDLVTGWGTPDGIYTMNALAGITTPDFSISTSSDGLAVNQLSRDQFVVTIKPLNGFGGSVGLSATGLPAGITAEFSPGPSANSYTLTLTTTYEANTGTSDFTITGVADSTTHSITVPLTVNAAPTVTTPVDLLQFFNRFNGIAKDSSRFTGGLDGDGYAYSATLLGKTVNWDNTPFNLGPPNQADVVSAQGQTIALPSGKFAGLRMLATGVNGAQTAQIFKLNYADTSVSYKQSLSDWFSPSGYPGESAAVTMAYRDAADGITGSGPFYLYGYSIRLDPNRTLRSVTLPADRNLEILAMTLAAPVRDTSLTANSFQLQQNYPNPFNLSTQISYTLTSASRVNLKIYDILGREVATLVNGNEDPGSYIVTFNGAGFASGVYFCRLMAEGRVAVMKMLLLK